MTWMEKFELKINLIRKEMDNELTRIGLMDTNEMDDKEFQ